MEKQKLDCILEFVQYYLKKCFETLELFESEVEAGIIANAKLYENFLDFLNTDYPKRKKENNTDLPNLGRMFVEFENECLKSNGTEALTKTADLNSKG